MLTKYAARKIFRLARKRLSKNIQSKISDIICENIISNYLKQIANKIPVLSYIPVFNEVDIKKINNYILNNGLTLFLPISQKPNILILKQTQSLNILKPNKFGILEPELTNADQENINYFFNISNLLKKFSKLFIICPGIAFDMQCARLGSGYGFYDNLLKNDNFNAKNIFKLGVIYDFALIDKLETTKYDIEMDLVITETLTITNSNSNFKFEEFIN